MFDRLWRWARPGSAGKPAPVVHTAPVASAEQPKLPTAAPAEPFLERLERELPPCAPVTAEHEPAVTALVMQVVAYTTQKKLDPPVVPALVPRVLAITGEPEVDLQRLTHVIQQDLAISAKLLSVANSPLFGTGTEVKSVRQAIAQLGSEQVAQVAIGLACRSNLDSERQGGSPFAARWQRQFQHGMTCALAAAQLAGKQDRSAQEAAFLGGLFHDVGKAVALRAIEALITAGKLAPPSDVVLDEALQRLHAYPGDEFYRKWTLPEPLMELCARHHQLEDVEGAAPAFYRVTLASSFDSLWAGSDASRREALAEARVSAARLGLSEPQLEDAYQQTRALADRAARMFGA
jgi:HD-like signal output (HDOD) protein